MMNLLYDSPDVDILCWNIHIPPTKKTEQLSFYIHNMQIIPTKTYFFIIINQIHMLNKVVVFLVCESLPE